MNYDYSNSTSDREYIITRISSEIESLTRELKNINYSLRLLATVVSDLRSEVNRKIGYLQGEISNLRDEMKKKINEIQGEIQTLREYVNERINSLRRDIHYLRDEMNRRVNELSNKISEVENYVQKVESRVVEAERNLNEHLREQDEVLKIHGEALLNSVASQVVSVIKSKYGKNSAITLVQISRAILIIVEELTNITILVLVEKMWRDLSKVVKEISSKIELFTGKIVSWKVLTLQLPEETRQEAREIPVWTFMAEE